MAHTPFDDLSQHTQAIQRIAVALCGDAAEAEDVGQEMWLAAHQRDGAAPAGWLPWLSGAGRRILWSRARSEARRREREHRVARDDSLPSAEERAIRMETEERLLKLVRRLPEAQSEVVYLRFWEGLPPREIAQHMGVSVEAVKTRQKRALASLRQRLSDETPGGRDVWMGALAGLPLASLPHVGVATSSLAYLGVLMSVKSILLALVLTLIGVGLWFSRVDAEQPSHAPVWVAVAERSVVGEESDPALVSNPSVATRAPGVDPVGQQPEVVSSPAEVLVITGRVWNVPSGGDRASATPAVGVRVRLQWGLAALGGEVEPAAVTDESGTFRLEHDAARYHRKIGVGAIGDESYASAFEEIEWKKGRIEPIDFDIYRVEFGALEGQVVDRWGAGIEGVRMLFGTREEPLRETVSDARGRFVFPKQTRHGHVLGELPGWMTLASPAVGKDEQGAWIPVRVVMCKTGVLRVRIETEEGQPLAGVRLALGPSASEPAGRKRVGGIHEYHALLTGETDANGVAKFSEVWAGVNLRLRPEFKGCYFWIERERGGFLVPETSAAGSRSISLPAKSERQLTLRVRSARSLKCRVLGPDGAPFPKAHVRLASERQGLMDPAMVLHETTTDEEGRCEIPIVSLLPMGPAWLTASDVQAHMFSWAPGVSPLASSRSLHLDHLPQETVTLTLAPTFEISGKLVDGEGEPLRGKVRVNPIDGELAGWRLTTGFSPETHTAAKGSFIIAGLPKGRYELVATSSKLARVVVQDVRAGTQDLVIRLQEPSAARIEVFFDTGGVPMEQYVALVGWHTPAKGLQPHFPALSRNKSYSDPVGWPGDLQGLWYGGGGSVNETAKTRYWLVATNEPHKVLNLDPGIFWIGAQARAQDGTLFAQMGTGLVQVAEGKYHVTFQMRPCVELSGSVRGLEQINDLALALALPNGKLLPLNVGRESMRSIIDFGALGDFQIKHVPAGKYELRIGTRAMLELGASTVTRAIELVPGTPLRLELEF